MCHSMSIAPRKPGVRISDYLAATTHLAIPQARGNVETDSKSRGTSCSRRPLSSSGIRLIGRTARPGDVRCDHGRQLNGRCRRWTDSRKASVTTSKPSSRPLLAPEARGFDVWVGDVVVIGSQRGRSSSTELPPDFRDLLLSTNSYKYEVRFGKGKSGAATRNDSRGTSKQPSMQSICSNYGLTPARCA